MSNTELIGCVQHDCAKCKAVQDEVYLRNGDVLRLMKERDALQAEVERLKSLAVMEFNEDEIPSFTQGYHPHELTTVVTADRCSDLVKMITDLRAQLAAAQAQEPVGFVESAVRGAGGFHARFSSGVFIPAGTQLFAAPVPQQPSVPEGWKQAVALAYGHLWHVNNEPMAPIPLRSSETAAYEARKQLRDLLTHEERGLAINQVQALLAAAPQPKE